MPTRILVIDDTYAMTDFFGELFAEDHYCVTTLLHSETTPTMIQALRPHLIILDGLYAPHVHRYPVLQYIAHAHTTGIPLLVCTDNPAFVDALAPELAVAHVPVVLKPFTIDDLLTAVANALHTALPQTNGHDGATGEHALGVLACDGRPASGNGHASMASDYTCYRIDACVVEGRAYEGVYVTPAGIALLGKICTRPGGVSQYVQPLVDRHGKLIPAPEHWRDAIRAQLVDGAPHDADPQAGPDPVRHQMAG